MTRSRLSAKRSALAALVIVLGVMAGMGGPANGTAATGPKEAPPIAITGLTWEPRPPGSWATVTAALHQMVPGRPFKGELWLVPEKVVIPAAPATEAPVTTTTLLGAVPATTTTTRPPPNPAEGVYMAPIALETRDATISFLVPVGTVSYRPEVYDDAGRLVATGYSVKPGPNRVIGVGLLSDRRDGLSVFQILGGGDMTIATTFQGGFPEDAAKLATLDVIVVADFDTLALNARQLQALEYYVLTGGSLVVAGGESGAKTVAALPEALVPLKPTGVAPASLGPLFGVLDEDTALTVPIVTGEVRSGRSVVAGPGGPPLIVEADYGWGRVVELSFDPLAVAVAMRSLPPGADPTRLLSTLPLGAGLLRAAHTPASPEAVGRTTPATTVAQRDPTEPLWSYLAVRAGGRASRTPFFELVVLPLMLAALVGAGVYLALKGRSARSRFWAGVPVVALVVAVLVGAAPYVRHRQSLDDDIVRIDRIGGGRALSDEYHHLSAIRGGEVGLSVPAAGAWVATAGAGPPALPDAFAGLADRGPTPGPGSVQTGGPIALSVDAAARGDARRLRLLRSGAAGVALDAHLRLTGGRLVGTVTNQGPEPLRDLAAHLPGGKRAELAPGIAAGATITVDASLVDAAEVASSKTPSKDRLSRALDPALDDWAAQMSPGRLALSALAPAGGDDLGSGVRRGSSIRVVAVPADIEAADSFDAGFGAPRLVGHTAGRVGSPTGVSVYDLRVPVGMTAAVALSVPKLINQLMTLAKGVPYVIVPQTDAYDWQTGTWRVLPNEGLSRPLTPGETAGGVVRVRVGPSNSLIPVGELEALEQGGP